ncbi:MAG: type II secretion system protein [Patescibacteria group bacterium]
MKLPTQRGYTLIEAIIYVAILAMLCVTFISLLFAMTRSYTSFRLAREITDSALIALERMTYEIRRASSIDLAQSTLDTHPGHLTLNTTDENDAPTTIEFYLTADNILLIEEGGAGQTASTSAARITVENLVFKQINTTEGEAVKVELTLSNNQGQVSRTEKFYTTAVLRESY